MTSIQLWRQTIDLAANFQLYLQSLLTKWFELFVLKHGYLWFAQFPELFSHCVTLMNILYVDSSKTLSLHLKKTVTVLCRIYSWLSSVLRSPIRSCHCSTINNKWLPGNFEQSLQLLESSLWHSKMIEWNKNDNK